MKKKKMNQHSKKADWPMVRLEDLVEKLVSGTSVSGEERIPLSDEKGLLKVSAVTSGVFRGDKVKAIGGEAMNRLRNAVSSNSVLVNRANGSAGLVGTAVFVKNAPEKTFLSDKLWQLTPARTAVTAMFLGYLLSWPLFRRQVLARSSGGTGMLNISSKAYLRIRVPQPSLPEQKKIAEILGTWDRAIETLQALIDAKIERKRGLMQQLLTGETRLPGFEGEWKCCKIGRLLKEVKRNIEWDDNHLYRLVSVRRRSGGFFFRPHLYGRDIKTKTLKTTETGDFVISKMQVVHGAMAVTPLEFDETHVSGSYITLISQNVDSLDMSFFSYLSMSPWVYHLAFISSYGVVIEKMTFNLKDFFKKELLLPSSRDEQMAIAKLLKVSENEIFLHQQQIKFFRDQKRGLMQKLLSGDVKVESI